MGFFDDDGSLFYDPLFDFNGDGKLDFIEEADALATYDEWEKQSRRSSENDDWEKLGW
ncbi:MAG: hypothetical protein II702_00180 [Clostridia bacterium]|nr:hypothetical protein [Clostridia bacterium]MBQ4243303.1 hypothetical protein [Clostridia bacterium]